MRGIFIQAALRCQIKDYGIVVGCAGVGMQLAAQLALYAHQFITMLLSLIPHCLLADGGFDEQ